MNTVTLLGRVATPPTYFCTERGRDLTRVILRTSGSDGDAAGRQSHHCIAWGPAALELHHHLRRGDQLAVRGELRYRERRETDGTTRVRTEILIRSFSFLGRPVSGSRGVPQIRSSSVTTVS